MASRTRSAGAILLACAAAAGCGGPTGSVVELERVEFLVLERPELIATIESAPERPVDVGMVMPRMSTQDAGSLPSIRMPPPATVEVRIPDDVPAGTKLAFTAGVDDSAYAFEEKRLVGFTVQRGEERLFEVKLHASDRVPIRDRVWARGEVLVGGGDVLTLRTSLEGATGDEPPLVGFGLLEVSVPFAVERERASVEHPNVILVMVDTLRADALSAYGFPEPVSPNIDALAARGTLFERALAPSSWTWPSTASLFTGLTPPEHGVLDQNACFLSYDHRTLAEAFQDAGWRTGAFSTNTLITATKNFDQGFETFEEAEWARIREIWPGVEAWLRDAGDERFFLYLHLTDPHTPWEPEPEFLERWAGDRPPGWRPKSTWNEIKRRLEGRPVDEARLQAYVDYDRSLYSAEIASLDAALGDLFALVDELGMTGETVIALTSDHGEEFFEHGAYHHTKQLFEEVLHVPLVLAGPGIEAGRRVSEPVEMRFLGPTLLAHLGLERRDNLAGVNLLDALQRSAAAATPFYAGTEVGWWVDETTGRVVVKERPMAAATRGDHRFVWMLANPEAPEGEERFYDHATDPGEEVDLSGQRATEVTRYREWLRTWLEEADRVRPGAFGGGEDDAAILRDLGYVEGDR